jgi:hypothetical protein
VSATWRWAVLAALVSVAGCRDLMEPGYRYGRVLVEVVEASGAPVPDVSLTLFTGARHMGYGRTDGRGHHEFGFVPRGGYGVTAQPPAGYRFTPGDELVTFQLDEGATREVRFVLHPEEAP